MSVLTQGMIDELQQIEAQHGGNVPTEAIVEVARDPHSALHQHPYFEWDLGKAAYAHWMEAARRVARVYVRIIADPIGGAKVMRAYVSMPDGNERTYTPTNVVLQQNRGSLINAVLDRIESAINSYPLPEFDPILHLCAQIRQAAAAPPPRSRQSRNRAAAGPTPIRGRRAGGGARPQA